MTARAELPDWLIERAALDEVPAASRARLEAADAAELAARVAALREQDAAELRAHPAAAALAHIGERVARHRARRAATRRRRGAALALVAVAAAALLLWSRRGDERPRVASVEPAGGVEGVRVKGAPRLVAFRKAGEGAERLEPGATVRPGDVLQLRYNGGGHSHGVIASIDGAGVVTLHFPEAPDAPPEATALSRETADLPHAYALDDAPRFERFFFVTGDAPLDVGRVLESLRQLARDADADRARLDLPPQLGQLSLLLRKPSRNR